MEKRAEPRRPTNLPARIITESGEYPCLMFDVSQHGARINIGMGIDMPENFILDMTQDGRVLRQCKVVHRDGLTIGVQFVPPHPDALPPKAEIAEI